MESFFVQWLYSSPFSYDISMGHFHCAAIFARVNDITIVDWRESLYGLKWWFVGSLVRVI